MIKRILSSTLILSLLLISGCGNNETSNENNTTQAPGKVITGSITTELKVPKETAKVGEYVQMDAEINTGEETVNSIQLIFDYNPELLEFDSVSTSLSAFTIWMNKKGSNGEVILSAGEPSPGVKGDNQKVATIVFKAKKDGEANVSLNINDSKIFTNEEVNRIKSEGHKNAKIIIEPTETEQ